MDYSFDNSLGRLTKIIASSLGHDLIRRLGEVGVEISPEEWCILSMLNGSKGESQTAIGVFLGYGKVNVLRLVRAMEERGLVVRSVDDDDRRFRYVRLTAEGETVYRKAAGYASETIAFAVKGLSAEEYSTCVLVLKRIAANLS